MFGLVDGNNFFVSCERLVNRRLVGRPVAVLSNNDGCCVSRSDELKALGVAMGTPYFQLRDREASGEISFCSSNYELYGDISGRMMSMLREDALDVEQYSIDEAFIVPPSFREAAELAAYGLRVRGRMLRWVGIPCGVGFAATRTLAKLANRIAKKTADGVFVLPDDPSGILAGIPVCEVWGVGRRLPAKLRADRIYTALDLRDAPDGLLRSIGGVTLLRTALELRGVSAADGRACDADPDSVSCSRSFGVPVTTRDGIAESIAAYASEAAGKLRRHGMLASGCSVYAQLFAPRGGEAICRTVVFAPPTDATNTILAALSREVDALFIPGARYRKTGVVFFGLEKADSPRQGDLFGGAGSASPLYRAVDALNARYGRGRVFPASAGVGARPWHMKRGKLSPRATTRWDELIVAR